MTPALTINAFRTALAKELEEVDLYAVGFVSADGRVYPFGTDTKVISTLFEVIVAPLVFRIAERFGYEVATPKQTVYPDFTLSPLGEAGNRIGLDVKTTYRRAAGATGKDAPIAYTLGSYTSYLRDPKGTKNIHFPYEQYAHQWVLGFLYEQRDAVGEARASRSLEGLPELSSPYQGVDWFLQDKHRVAGLRPGSGNTANIGSMKTNDFEALRAGTGPFSDRSKEVCDDYWRNFDKAVKSRPYGDLQEYDAWKAAQLEASAADEQDLA